MNTYLLVLIFTFVINLLQAGEKLSNMEKYNLLNEAEKLFRKANSILKIDPNTASNLYEECVLKYEKLIESGISNGEIFYNLGNIYFKLNKIGKAIVNYKRAEKYILNDHNLKKNLQLCRDKRVDKFQNPEMENIMRILFFFHYDLSLWLRTRLFTIFWAITWIIATLIIFIRIKLLRIVEVISIIFTITSGISIGIEYYMDYRYPEGVITSTQVIARKGDDYYYDPSFTTPLHEGTEFRLLQKRNNWYYIKLIDGRLCWIPENSAQLMSNYGKHQ